MTSSPQPLQVRRRSGAKRGDHGGFVASEPAPTPAPETPATSTTASPAGKGDTSTTSSSAAASRPAASAATRSRRVGKPVSDAAAAAKTAYDAKPKVIVRGVDEDVYYKLRAIYKHQLRSPDGIEGWSEFGRQLLTNYVEHYEAEHGPMTGGEHVELPPGRRMGQ